MGLRMTGTVIGWWVYLLTGSPLALGLVGLSEVIPAVSLALYAGQHIDRCEKRSLLLRCILMYIGCILFLWLLSSGTASRHLSPWTICLIIFAVIAITGAIRSFSGPTFSSLIAQIVPREILPAAASISSATWLVASISGHAAGGFLIAGIGIQNTFLVILLQVCAGYFILSRLKPKEVLVSGKANTWSRVKEGLQYVFHSKELLGAMSLDLFAVLFGGAVALVPVFANEILHVGPIGFGWLNAATDIGSIITVTILTVRPLKKQQGRTLFYAVAGFGICIILFALSTVYWFSFLALMISGCMDGVSVIVRSTILQLKTPDELRGRVMSVSSMFINSSNELGQFESGVAARLMGTVPSVVFGGCMTIAVVIFTWFKAPTLREMEY
jgi:MFS family permease